MVCSAGPLVIATNPRVRPRAYSPPGLHAQEPEPAAGAHRHLLPGEPTALPRRERRRLRFSRRRGHHPRPAQPDNGGAPRAAARLVAPPRSSPSGADAARTRTRSRHPQPQQAHLRDGVEELGLGDLRRSLLLDLFKIFSGGMGCGADAPQPFLNGAPTVASGLGSLVWSPL